MNEEMAAVYGTTMLEDLAAIIVVVVVVVVVSVASLPIQKSAS